MLTRSMLTGPRSRVADFQFDPSGIARSAEELATRDLPRLLRRADVPGRLETGLDAASDALRSAVEQIPGRKRRSLWQSWFPGLAIMGVLTALAITSMWVVRGVALAKARDMDLAFDQDAHVRASDDGMPSIDNVDGSAAAIDR